MCVTDRHDMTLAVKVVLNPNTTNATNQPISTKLGQNVCHHKISVCSIMDLTGPELFELSALELENLQYLSLFTL